MKTRTIFYLTLLILVLYGVFFFSFYTLDLFKAQHSYSEKHIELELKNLSAQLEGEKSDAASTLYSLRALFNAHKNTLSTEYGQKNLSKAINELMQTHSSQFAAYFALEEPLAQSLVNKKGWTLASYKNGNYKKTAVYSKPENRIIKEYFDATYKKEVWYKVAKRSQNVEVSDIYFDENYLKEWMFSAGLGMYEGGVFQGMVGVDILLDSFFLDVESKNLNSTGGFLLVDKNTGVVLTKIIQPNSLFGEHNKRQSLSLKKLSFWSKIANEELNYKSIKDKQGNAYKISTHGVGDSSWMLVAFQNEALALKPLYKKVTNFAGISIVLITFITIVIGSLLKQLSRATFKLHENTKALKRSESRFNVVFDQSLEYMGLTDLDGNLEEVNAAVIKASGAQEDEIINKPIWEAPWWEHALDIQEKIKEAVTKARNGYGSTQEIEFENIANETRYLSFSIAPIRDEMGDVAFLFSLTQDINKQKEIESSLKDAMEMAELSNIAKSEFLANMSHEIRTPMNGVLGMLQFLQQSELSKEQKSQVEIAANSAQSLLRIIDDILDISKIEAGKVSIKSAPFSLRDSVDSVMQLMQYKAEEKGIALTLSFPDIDSDVIGDSGRIEQVLKNLLSNAIKFTEQGSITVTVTLEKKNHHYYEFYCSVEDTGIGIPLDKQSALFKSFSQIDPSSSRHYEGTGLGLHISKQLCFLMGGSLDVSSEPDKGSKFFFRLLLQRQHSDNKKHEKQDVHEPLSKLMWSKGSNVLLVEDNEVNQIVAKKMLQNIGLQCDVVSSGVLALSKLKESKSDYLAIFMDCQMPEMDGYETTERIRNNEAGERYNDIPIIALTAHAMAGDRERCLIAGMNDYVVKPIEQKALKDVLISVLSEKKEGESNEYDNK